MASDSTQIKYNPLTKAYKALYDMTPTCLSHFIPITPFTSHPSMTFHCRFTPLPDPQPPFHSCFTLNLPSAWSSLWLELLMTASFLSWESQINVTTSTRGIPQHPYHCLSHYFVLFFSQHISLSDVVCLYMYSLRTEIFVCCAYGYCAVAMTIAWHRVNSQKIYFEWMNGT